MNEESSSVKAVHLDGGNFFDDMRIDIAASHQRFAALKRHPQLQQRSLVRNAIARAGLRLAQRLRLHECMITGGIRTRWLDEFRSYWAEILGGRPLWSAADFFVLAHDYRKRQQYIQGMEWQAPAQHLANWQTPNHLYQTLHFAAKLALNPLVAPNLWPRIPQQARILEYGCSLAPYYHCYRNFYTHLDCHWVLADIPNFPYHYARYRYRNDSDVNMVVIDAEDFQDPLRSAEAFDVIILTTVLEHLQEPDTMVAYLIDRLHVDGLLVFDFIKSDGTGLDHPQALLRRAACIEVIRSRTDLLIGRMDDPEASIEWCVARKKP